MYMSFKNLILTLFVGSIIFLSSCEPPATDELLIDELLTSLERADARYFDFTYERKDKHNGQIERLSGLSFLKRNKDTYINNAYFNLNESEQINYLQLLEDGEVGVNRLVSQLLDENALYNLRDSINSPVLINPQWLSKLINDANDLSITHDQDKAEVALHLRTDKQEIQLLWLKDRKVLSSLRINELEDGQPLIEHKWHFNYLSKNQFELLAAQHEEILKTQRSMML
ncbi:hypothetical protein GCM10027429_19850 [Marivirga atlantica]|jgi:hypothetical protein